jgi:hypothetical protein
MLALRGGGFLGGSGSGSKRPDKIDAWGNKQSQPEGTDPTRKQKRQPWRIPEMERRRAARVRRARNAGWANPEAAADLRDDDLDPRKPRTERELAIMEAGVDELTSSDSAEDTERSEATAEKLEDLAALIYRAYGPQRGFNQTAAGFKHRGSEVFPDLDTSQWLDDLILPLLDGVALNPNPLLGGVALNPNP